MRELTARIRFLQPCLGNVPDRGHNGRFLLPRNHLGQVIFMNTWHQSNMRLASRVLNKHQEEAPRILWDVVVDGTIRRDSFQRWYTTGRRKRFVLHEAFFPGQIVGINCLVPTGISDDDFWELLRVSGQYQGISPYRNGPYGLFEVVSIIPRRPVAELVQRESSKNEFDTGEIKEPPKR